MPLLLTSKGEDRLHHRAVPRVVPGDPQPGGVEPRPLPDPLAHVRLLLRGRLKAHALREDARLLRGGEPGQQERDRRAGERAGQVGAAQRGIDGRARHPGQGGRRDDGEVPARGPQRAGPLLFFEALRLPSRGRRRGGGGQERPPDNAPSSAAAAELAAPPPESSDGGASEAAVAVGAGAARAARGIPAAAAPVVLALVVVAPGVLYVLVAQAAPVGDRRARQRQARGGRAAPPAPEGGAALLRDEVEALVVRGGGGGRRQRRRGSSVDRRRPNLLGELLLPGRPRSRRSRSVGSAGRSSPCGHGVQRRGGRGGGDDRRLWRRRGGGHRLAVGVKAVFLGVALSAFSAASLHPSCFPDLAHPRGVRHPLVLAHLRRGLEVSGGEHERRR